MIPRLGESPDSPFPPIETALEEPDGLLAWGGDLTEPRLLNAYSQGIFPWYSADDPFLWWSPAQRCILSTRHMHLSKRLVRRLRSGELRLTADEQFLQVVSTCADCRESTWITDEMKSAYLQLHRSGYAHSIEAWHNGELVGGLYGVALGKVFFAESMFSSRNDASKIVLAHLCRWLAEQGFPFLDCQVTNPHLLSLGASMIVRQEFMRQLNRLVKEPFDRGDWSGVWNEYWLHQARQDWRYQSNP